MAVVSRFCALGLALVLWFGPSASAQTASSPGVSAPTFAILSLVGDQFDVTMRREEVGTRLDPNGRRSYPVNTAALDDVAVNAAERVVTRLKPAAPVVRFSIRDPRLFELQDRLLVDNAESHGVRDALAKLLRDYQATRLILVTKWRDEARFKVVEGTMGIGKINGLGFYVDPYTRMEQQQSGEGATGFLGAYAYVHVTVLDVASMAPIRSTPGRESEMTLPIPSSGAVAAWDALTPAGKVDALERVLRRAVESATTTALAD